MDLKNKVIAESECLFIKYGIKSISMDDISSRLGISKKTLYQVVNDKEELVKKAIKHHMDQEREDLQLISSNSFDAIDEMVKVTQHVLEFFKRLNPITQFDLEKYYRDYYVKMKKQHFEFIYAVIKFNLEKGIKENIYRNDIDTDIISRLYIIKAMAILDDEIFPEAMYEKASIFKEHMIYHLKGIISEKGLSLFNQHIQSLK
ncbi:MAG TPA: TetR/AcrR family transcriptional regulator [Saprospiraceae bacterium]|nr:TetR/AcrR family transcriptional regulator [Saprospiraceae bacterium]